MSEPPTHKSGAKPRPRPKATTDRAIKAAKPEASQYRLSVGQGLHLLVTPNGSKLWQFRYRYQGKEQILSLGPYPDVSLRDADFKRTDARKLLIQGVNPMAECQRNRKALKSKALTFGAVAERWFNGRAVLAKKPWSPKTQSVIRFYLDKDILPAFGHRPIESISRIDLMAFVTELEKRGNTSLAIKIRGWLKVIFADALNHEEISINPADNLKPSHYATGAEATHHPSVSFGELPDLLAAVEQAGSHILTKLYLRMLLLTGVRQSELRGANWNEVDLKSATWNIPAERMKMRKPHAVPLPRQAIEILNQVRFINPKGRWFDIGGKEFGRATLNAFLERIGYAGRQSPHGFRHLIATELNSRGYNPDWVELQLAHRVGGSQIRSIYVHSDFLENRRLMMQEWADSIESVSTSSPT